MPIRLPDSTEPGRRKPDGTGTGTSGASGVTTWAVLCKPPFGSTWAPLLPSADFSSSAADVVFPPEVGSSKLCIICAWVPEEPVMSEVET